MFERQYVVRRAGFSEVMLSVELYYHERAREVGIEREGEALSQVWLLLTQFVVKRVFQLCH